MHLRAPVSVSHTLLVPINVNGCALRLRGHSHTHRGRVCVVSRWSLGSWVENVLGSERERKKRQGMEAERASEREETGQNVCPLSFVSCQRLRGRDGERARGARSPLCRSGAGRVLPPTVSSRSRQRDSRRACFCSPTDNGRACFCLLQSPLALARRWQETFSELQNVKRKTRAANAIDEGVKHPPPPRRRRRRREASSETCQRDRESGRQRQNACRESE